jgi:23S rRNA (uracil1939-C5)-methyltransferase
MKIELYNEKTRTGLLRHVLIRYAHKTDEVMVVFVTSKKMFPSRRNLVNALVKEFKEIKTIVQNVNPRNTSIVQQDETILLYGDGMITDELCSLKISFSNRSFYQIHSEQCEVLYDMARKMCDLTKTDTVLDTYCGVGTIGLTLASSCKSVTGVEINPEAIENAKLNAKQNNIKNAKFISMDSTRYMMEAKKFRNHYDVIILDPPRAGTTKDFIEASTSLQPKKILYISCDPKTMMRDLVMFRQKGYMTNKIELVDMFPFTEHIESICVLTKREIGNVNKKNYRR